LHKIVFKCYFQPQNIASKIMKVYSVFKKNLQTREQRRTPTWAEKMKAYNEEVRNNQIICLSFFAIFKCIMNNIFPVFCPNKVVLPKQFQLFTDI